MRTVKAALVAAIAIVALVVSLLSGLAEESGSLHSMTSFEKECDRLDSRYGRPRGGADLGCERRSVADEAPIADPPAVA